MSHDLPQRDESRQSRKHPGQEPCNDIQFPVRQEQIVRCEWNREDCSNKEDGPNKSSQEANVEHVCGKQDLEQEFHSLAHGVRPMIQFQVVEVRRIQ